MADFPITLIPSSENTVTAKIYLSGAEALSIIQSSPQFKGKIEATEDIESELAIASLWATRRLENHCTFIGEKTDPAQNLHFPIDGATEIPDDIKLATVVLIVASILQTNEKVIKSEQIGKLRREYLTSSDKIFPETALEYLRKWRDLTRGERLGVVSKLSY